VSVIPGGSVLAAGTGGDDGGAQLAGIGVFGEGEDVPGDVGAGDGLDHDPVAGAHVAGERAVGELEGAGRVPVQAAGGQFSLRGDEVLADAAEVGYCPVRKKRNSSRGPGLIALSAGPVLAVLTQISRARGAPSRIALMIRVRASLRCRSGGEVMGARGC